ncbi:hypothetical protein NPIL_392271 [Nephila pilipes]|uniref:Uncharacterized protein n=1 Tax=Nephila pilipes TaxID=299642 RepID=A0A8X6N826_NEPPI|nr:hypothetical protein NPIL_392271 [Nephila pilipes]
MSYCFTIQSSPCGMTDLRKQCKFLPQWNADCFVKSTSAILDFAKQKVFKVSYGNAFAMKTLMVLYTVELPLITADDVSYLEDIDDNILKDIILNDVPHSLEMHSMGCNEVIIRRKKKEKPTSNGIEKVHHSKFLVLEKNASNVK